MLNVVVEWSNVKLASVRVKYKSENRQELKNVDQVEMEEFLGLLIYTSVFKSNHEDIECLFATDGMGREIFRSVMSAKRFAVLLTCLRFADPSTREQRKAVNPLAPIQELFESFIQNCQTEFSVYEYVCIDERLVGLRGRSRFRMYIPNKPRKYRLKIMILTNARNNYVYNAYVYTDQDSDGMGLSVTEKKPAKPTQSVLRLSKPLFGSNRNVTADNWFTSIELVQLLKSNGLTYVGPMKKVKRHIPPEFLSQRHREIGLVRYGFTKDITILSYVPKKKQSRHTSILHAS
ncbi:uncharacterized protein [Diabrotica undecimpunctata]|uniref:uncharacterized protein n=1 Tax=Diabrotica undecimpunctata TaxID=50387 RepID=UPI003B641CFD